MNILLDQNKEIQKQLEEVKTSLDNKQYLGEPIIKKISIINDKLLDISNTLQKLNINIKKQNQIQLTEEELDYVDNERKSNELISKIMPILTLLSIN